MKVRTPLPASVNFHLLAPCNMRCKGCFATFHDVRAGLPKGMLPKADVLTLSALLGQHFSKLTFAGGEPTLVPYLGEAMAAAKAKGTTTMLVSNGTRLSEQWLTTHRDCLDWVTLSIDSPDPQTHIELGRAVHGRAMPTERYIELATMARDLGYRLKINTVVSALNHHQDFRALLMALRPERWKVFQVLPIDGQNDGSVEPLLIDSVTFDAFAARHRGLFGIEVVTEDNTAMTGSYAMVSPDGRFYDNTSGRLRYSEPILSVGVETAWAQVEFNAARFDERGGHYDWRGGNSAAPRGGA